MSGSHTLIVAEILYEVMAEAERTYENAHDLGKPENIGTPTREDYVSDVVRVLQKQLDSGFWKEAGS